MCGVVCRNLIVNFDICVAECSICICVLWNVDMYMCTVEYFGVVLNVHMCGVECSYVWGWMLICILVNVDMCGAECMLLDVDMCNAEC